MVISEDSWHSNLLPSVWQWSCHYLVLRLRSGATVDQIPFSHTLGSIAAHRGYDDDAMVRQCDGYDTITMVRWRWTHAFLHHRYHVIAPSRYRLFCTCAIGRIWQQDNIAVFSCNDLSITNQVFCMLVLNALYFKLHISHHRSVDPNTKLRGPVRIP